LAEVICINPKCQGPNRDGQIYCRICGWRLPMGIPEKAANGKGAQVAVSADIPALPHTDPDTSVARRDELTAALEQLIREHQQLISDHQQLATQHLQVTDSNAQLKQDRDQSAASLAQVQEQHEALQQQKQEMETQLQGLLAQVTELTGLLQAPSIAGPETHQQLSEVKQKLLATENELTKALEKVREFESSPIGQVTRPLWSKLLSWILVPIVGAIGGAVLGIHTPFNPYRSQAASASKVLTQTPSQGKDQQELIKARQDVENVQQQLASDQQNAAQLKESNQELTKKLQVLGSAMTATQNQLSEAKASVDKEHAGAVEAQQQLQAERVKNQQLLSRAGSADALQKLLSRHPYLNYSGPMQGTLTLEFEIHNDKPAQIQINGTSASGTSNIAIKSIKGNPLPNVPVVVESLNEAVGVFTPPEPGSWQKMTLSLVGKGKRQAGLHWIVATQ